MSPSTSVVALFLRIVLFKDYRSIVKKLFRVNCFSYVKSIVVYIPGWLLSREILSVEANSMPMCSVTKLVVVSPVVDCYIKQTVRLFKKSDNSSLLSKTSVSCLYERQLHSLAYLSIFTFESRHLQELLSGWLSSLRVPFEHLIFIICYLV